MVFRSVHTVEYVFIVRPTFLNILMSLDGNYHVKNLIIYPGFHSFKARCAEAKCHFVINKPEKDIYYIFKDKTA